MKYAACVLVEREDGAILCVSRYDNLSDWNLPGGKREPGESAIANAVRELKEETGLIATQKFLVLAHSGPCGNDFCCDTYMVKRWQVSGKIKSSHEGTADWKTWADILKPECSFFEYNRELFAKVAAA